MFITRRHTVAAALTVPALIVGITACGGGSSSGTGAQTQPTAQPTASRPAVNPVQNAATRRCLKAAGIKLPKTPAGATNGTPPSNFTASPNGTPPSNFTPPAGAGGLNSTKVQQALKACGITVPTSPSP
jgi:hypothetical protein